MSRSAQPDPAEGAPAPRREDNLDQRNLTAPSDDAKPGDILVVDDNPANLLAIEAALGDLALNMRRAHSGGEALRLLLERDFALILLDVNMPSLDGYETARLIRDRKRSRHTPIIFVTAYSRDDREVLQAYALGAVDFLFKPIVPEVLRAKVSVFVELSLRTAEVARQAEQLREHERLAHEQRLLEERRHWQEESLRRQRDEAQRAAQALALKAEELAATVEEKERIEQALLRSNQELAAADRRKDEFLAVLGHELRNPLAPLVAGLEILKRRLHDNPGDAAADARAGRRRFGRRGPDTGGPDAAQAEHDDRLARTREAMERQVRYLARLVDDLLDVSRINSGKIELRKAPVSLAEIVEQAVAAVRPALEEHQHHLEVSLPAEPVSLVADAVRLTQVIANLLNNAIRYTGQGGRIRLCCDTRADDSILVIEVIDNGRGIPPELLPRIFGMFVQEQTGGGGLGLGLTLVERLVKLHGGRVSAASEGADKGATFTVELPLVATPTGDSGALFVEATSGQRPPPDAPSAPAAPAQEQRPLAICLVDDNPDIRETMCDLLSTWGHNVETATDGPSGVELILRRVPDLAFVDIGLPKLDGYGVAAQVRARLPSGRTRLVAMSGFGQEADRRRSLEVGFNAHLVKPADIDAILNVLSPLPER
jgi:two-component system, sensor histidine kinase